MPYVQVKALHPFVHNTNDVTRGEVFTVVDLEAKDLKKSKLVEIVGDTDEPKAADKIKPLTHESTLVEDDVEDLLGEKMDAPVQNKMAEPASNKTTKNHKAK